jgi:hypothetical protein
MSRLRSIAVSGALVAAVAATALTLLPAASASTVHASAVCTGCPEPATTLPPVLAGPTTTAAPGSPATTPAPNPTTPQRIAAALKPGQVKPAPKSVPKGAGGQFAAVIGDNVFTWAFATDNISGAATARIEAGSAGKNGGTMLVLCQKCAGGAAGNTSISDAMERALRTADIYVEISTPKNPNGELRGQLRD